MPVIVDAGGQTYGGGSHGGASAVAPSAGVKKLFRYGCIAGRIGADMQHRLGVDLEYPLTDPRGKYLTANQLVVNNESDAARVRHFVGDTIQKGIDDITRFPAEAAKAHWVCKHPGCTGKTWASKKELLAGHPDEKYLKAREETHCYYAVYEEAAVEPVPAKGDQKAKPGKPARIMLLSDEE